MPLYLKNGALLVSRGKLARSCDCCVPTGCCGKGESLASAISYVPYVITAEVNVGVTNTLPSSSYDNLGTWSFRTLPVISESRYCLNEWTRTNYVDKDGYVDSNEYPVIGSISLTAPATTNECTLNVAFSGYQGANLRVPNYPLYAPFQGQYGPGFSTKFSLTKTVYQVTTYVWAYMSFGTGYPPPSLPTLPYEDYFVTYEESLAYPDAYYYPGQTYGYAMYLFERYKYSWTLTISEA